MDDDLYGLFCEFAAFGAGKGAVAELDNAKFAKFARDCGVLDKTVTATQVDLAFTKAKDKAARKIGYDQFISALKALAAMKYPGDSHAFDTLKDKILSSHGPKVASKVDVDASGVYAKLTDTSLYTGAHKERFDDSGAGKGLAGRDSVAIGVGTAGKHHGGAVSDLSQVTREGMRGGTLLSSASKAKEGAPATIDRSTVRRASASPAPAADAPRRGSGTRVSPAPPRRSSAASSDHAAGGDIRGIFLAYCNFGGTSTTSDEMDNAKFAKLCRESGIIDKKVTPASVDITFSKVKDKAKRAINYEQFIQALRSLGKEKYAGEEPEAAAQHIIDLVLSAGGPALVGTSKADSSGVYGKLTDTSLYTGAHKERFTEDGTGRGLAGRDSVSIGGAPGKYHGGAVADLSQITRSNL